MKILFLGDIVGGDARRTICNKLLEIKLEHKIECLWWFWS
jgi:calcineurin-like phosphoesterase